MQKPGVNVLCVIDTSPSRSAQPRFAAARKVWLHARARSAALHLACGACSVNARVWLCSYALNLTLTHSPSLSCIADRHPQLARQRRRVRAHDHTALPSQPHTHNHTITTTPSCVTPCSYMLAPWSACVFRLKCKAARSSSGACARRRHVHSTQYVC